MTLHHRLIMDVKLNKNILTRNLYPDITELLQNSFNINEQESRTMLFMLAYHIKTDNTCNMYRIRDEHKLSSDQYCFLMDNALSLMDKNLISHDGYSRNRRRKRNLEIHPDFEFNPSVVTFILKGTLSIGNIDYSDIYSILNYFDQIVEDRDNEKLSTNEYFDKVDQIAENCHENIRFSKFLKRLKVEEKSLLLYLILKRLSGDDNVWFSIYIDDIYESIKSAGKFREKFVKGNLKLQKEGYIENDEDKNWFRADVCVSLTRKFIKTYLDVYARSSDAKFESKFLKVIAHDEIKQSLIFESQLQNEINTVSKAVGKTRLKQLRKRLKENRMPVGFTCLLHGAPGTGKTASVYEIASKTKRDVLHVDISSIRSMWVGESEKNLKKIFEDYYEAKNFYDETPILLFNEADSLISKRVEASRSVDHMNNSMQNILLEELERFDGILFATTNLTMNMDDAFSRRFLYKICFPVPDMSARAKIWRQKIPALSAKDAGILGSYKISGGQIENISRKLLIASVLHNNKTDIDEIITLIHTETSFKQNTAKIGF